LRMIFIPAERSSGGFFSKCDLRLQRRRDQADLEVRESLCSSARAPPDNASCMVLTLYFYGVQREVQEACKCSVGSLVAAADPFAREVLLSTAISRGVVAWTNPARSSYFLLRSSTNPGRMTQCSLPSLPVRVHGRKIICSASTVSSGTFGPASMREAAAGYPWMVEVRACRCRGL